MVMRTLRNKVSLIIWLSAVLLIAMVVGLVAPNFMAGGKNLAGAAAVVNGQPVDAQEYSDALDQRLEQARQAQGGDLSEADSTKVRRDTLNSLIDEELAFDNAKSLGQTMSPEEFRRQLENDPSLQDSQGRFDESRYEQILQMQAEQGVTWQQAEQNFQRAMLLAKVRDFWASQAVLTPAEEAAAEARYNRRVKATALVWNLDRLRAQVRPTEDELHTYYSENKQQWAKAAQVKLRQILVRADFGAATATAEAKAERIWAKLKAGADFKTLASTENSDDASRQSAGDLGWVAHDDLRHVVLADAAFSLKKGQFSRVLYTSDGYTILKVEDRRPGFEPTFANSRDKAAKALGTQRAAMLAASLAQRALAALGKGESVEAAAKETQGTVLETGWFGRDDALALPALGSSPDFAKGMLSLDKGASLPAPVTTAKAVAIAVLSDEKPGSAPAKASDAEARAEAARQDAVAARTKSLYQAWIVALRKKADIVDQSGVL
jgi:peptidyl-prolyl cis-trans isomerase D